MKKQKELLAYLKSKSLRMTPSKKLLIQFFLDNQNRRISAKELQEHVAQHLPKVDRTTIYRNIEKFIALEFIQELDLPNIGKSYQFVFDSKVHHYYTCKKCGKTKKGDEKLFAKIERALKEIHDFSKAQLSVVFYGHCADCGPLS
jgi:Fe2+ or Zn2+ uptake regulation protein